MELFLFIIDYLAYSTQVSRDSTVCSFPESRFERRDVILQILKSIPESSQGQSLMKLTVGYFPYLQIGNSRFKKVLTQGIRISSMKASVNMKIKGTVSKD
jgi:hypothetical protein